MTNIKPEKKRFRLTMRRKEMLVGYMFILPLMIGLAVFFFPMLFMVVRYSFHDIYIPFGERYQLIPRGLDHFNNALFIHPTFVRVLTETVVNLFWNVPLIIFFSLFMAILLNRDFTGRIFVRALFFLPVVLAIPAIQNNIAMMTEMMTGGMATHADMAEQFEGFNAFAIAGMLFSFGVPVNIVMFIIDAIARLHLVLRSAGVQMIIFLAALQAIPRSLYEVAQVEGATAYETFWKITMPMISPLILTNVVYTIIDNYIHSAPVTMATNLAFGGAVRNFGLSSAFSLISALVITAIIFISTMIISRKVFYQT